MKKTELYIPSADNKTQIHTIIWDPEVEDVKAVVQLVHGMSEYIDRYNDFAVYLAGKGYGVIGHDHLGHGKSLTNPSRLGFISEKDGHEILLKDISAVSHVAEESWPGKKRILLGHSMGSFIVRRYAALHSEELDGAVFMGTGWVPGAASGLGASIARRAIKKNGAFAKSPLLTQMVFGSNNKPFAPARTPMDWLSRNEANVDRYIADPLCGFEFTSGAYLDFFRILQHLSRGDDEQNIRKDLPVLIISGENDPVGGAKSCPTVLKHYEKAGLKDVTLKLFHDDRHEILNELDRDIVFKYISDWFGRVIDGDQPMS